MIKYSQVASVILNSVSATTTSDHGQFHDHMPNSLVRDNKTGGPMNVHIAPHSHDDGLRLWMNTSMDQEKIFNGPMSR